MAPNSDAVSETMTAGEVYRIAKDIKGDVKEIRERLDEYPTMRDMANVENRLRDAESNIKWAWRSVLLALAGVVFNIVLETSKIVP